MASKRTVSRRDFIGSLAMAWGLWSLGGTKRPLRAGEKGPDPKLITRKLGKTGLELPIVSMGVMNANLSDLVKESYRLGVRHFDTAWIYQWGNNERMVGRAIQELGVRKEVVIATKFHLGDVFEREDDAGLLAAVRRRLGESLERLQTDYVDILYFHDVSDPQQIRWPTLENLLAELKKERKIRFAGVSCHANVRAVVQEMVRRGTWDVALVAFNFAMADDADLIQTLRDAADKGLGLIAMKTQAGGDWWRSQFQRSEKAQGRLNQTAMLKWVLRHPFITTAVPGYTTFDQLHEDISVAYDLTYTPEEKRFLEDRNIRLGLNFCRQCGSCRAQCPARVDVPTLMRTHMYAFQYRNLDQATRTLRFIPAESGLGKCLDCSACVVDCPHAVSVKGKIAELKAHAASYGV